jgi:DNA (cytosine-5)-methyltransferase 1
VAAHAIPFDTTQICSDKNYSNPRAGDPCHPLAARAHVPAIAFAATTSDLEKNVVFAIQERAISENADAGPGGAGIRKDGVSYTLEARQVPQAIAFANRTREGVKLPEIMADGLSPSLTNPGAGGRSDSVNVCVPVCDAVQVQWSSGGGKTENPTAQALRSNAEHNCQFARIGMAVRRLTPRECERLQGFPDDYTAIQFRNKPAADGPRYKALGNSMAVPVMRWIGARIAAVETTREETASA